MGRGDACIPIVGVRNLLFWRCALSVVYLMSDIVVHHWRKAGLVCFRYAWLIVVRWLFAVWCLLLVVRVLERFRSMVQVDGSVPNCV